MVSKLVTWRHVACGPNLCVRGGGLYIMQLYNKTNLQPWFMNVLKHLKGEWGTQLELSV